jgi:exosortase D (VPLPA-CTERM-specific)
MRAQALNSRCMSFMKGRTTTALALLLASYVLLYHDIAVKLVQDWAFDENYSHGFLIVPIALYFIWGRRHELATLKLCPSILGLIVVIASLSVLLVGLLGSELFLTRISLLGILSGTVVFLYGWQHLRILALPLAFLLLMIPIPRIVFDQLVFPLQLLASRLAEISLSALDVPVLREGNLIVLANATLEVAEACSGLRSLISLLTLGIVYGYFADPRAGVRIALVLGTVPVAIIANGLRVAGTGLAAQYYGAKAAEAFFDTFSGWVLFTIAFVLLFVLYRFLLWIAPLPTREDKETRRQETRRQEDSERTDRETGRQETGDKETERTIEKSYFPRAVIMSMVLVAAAIYLGDAAKTEAVAIREPLARLSTQVGKWQGQPAEKLSDQILAKLGVDEYVSRFYFNPGHSQIHLYVGYYGQQRQGDTIHSPKNCLPGAGWLPVKSGRTVIPDAAGAPIEVNRYVIQKGLEKQVVLYWYQSHGRVIASEYWAKIYLVLDAIRMNRTDGALVRVISPAVDSEQTAEQRSIDFVRALLPHLNRHLPL